MKEFHIKHDKESIRLESEFSKFDSLERIILLSAMEFIKKGKVAELKDILSVIEDRMK